MTLDSPQGKPLDLHADPASNAERRYERAKELEAELERKQAVVDQLAPLPADPVSDRIRGQHDQSQRAEAEAKRRDPPHTSFVTTDRAETLLRDPDSG